MKTLQQVFADVNRANLAFGKTIDSVASELSFGETALHVVATWGDAEAIETLVSNGAEIDKPGEYGATPLHYAAMHGHLGAVAALVELGARAIQDDNGYTPRELARVLGHAVVEQYLAADGF